VTSRCAAEEIATGASHWRVLLAVHCVYYRPPRRGKRALSSGSSGGAATRGWQQHGADEEEDEEEGQGVRALWGGAGAGCLVYTLGQAPAALAFATAAPLPSPTPSIDHDEVEGEEEEEEEEDGFGGYVYVWPVRQCRVHSLVGTADDVRAYFATVPAAPADTAAGNGGGEGEEGRGMAVEVGGAAPGDVVMTLLHSSSPAVAYSPRPPTNGAPGAKEGSDYDPWAAETLRREARDGVLPPVATLGRAVLPLNQVSCFCEPFL